MNKKAILISINRPHTDRIFNNKKFKEVRKTPPKNIDYPYKAYVYETKSNGGVGQVIGEFICNGTVTVSRPIFATMAIASHLRVSELLEYAKESKKLSFMDVSEPIRYKKPLALGEFDLERPPQSWQYINVINE